MCRGARPGNRTDGFPRKHGANCSEIRRNFGCRRRAHQERRPSCQSRSRGRQRGGGRRLGDGGRDQPARRLDAGNEPPARCARIRCRRRLRRAGDGGADGAGTAGPGSRRAVLARLANSDPHRRHARQGAHRGDRDRRDRAPLGCGASRRGRGLPGDRAARPDHDARARRVGYVGRGVGRRAEGRSLRYLHRCRRGLHDRSADRCESAQAR